MKRLFTVVIAALIAALSYSQDYSKVIENTRQADEQVIRHDGYVTCYAYNTLQPRWVSWVLSPERLSNDVTGRTDQFLPDPEVKGETADTYSYSRTNYDRGHMCPAADCKYSLAAMEESFYLSNVCLQDRTLNAKTWCDLEKQCRFWSKNFYKTEVYVVAGPLYASKEITYVGRDNLPVPSHFWKVVLKKDRQGWSCIGFIFPNTPCEDDFREYACCVDDIEKVTGLDFFSDLTDPIENAIERSFDLSRWK